MKEDAGSGFVAKIYFNLHIYTYLQTRQVQAAAWVLEVRKCDWR
jgi:hypothetical protein